MDVTQPLPWSAPTLVALRATQTRHVHAILLFGPAGIGKKAAALEFARWQLCESPNADGSACGHCSSCALMATRNHPDLRMVVPDALAHWRPVANDSDDDEGDVSNQSGPSEAEAEPDPARGRRRVSNEILLAQVQGWPDFFNLTTHRGGRRVVVAAPVESLHREAANFVLKMLEEPPPRSLLLLVSDQLDEVLPTIRSRCVLVRASVPTWAQSLTWLKQQGAADAEAELAAAGGAPLVALEGAAGRTNERSESELRQTLLKMLAQGGRLHPAEIAARIPARLEIAPAIALFQRWSADLLLFRATGKVRYHGAQAVAIARIATMLVPARVLLWWSELAQMRASAEHPLNSRLVVEAALLGYVRALSPA